MAIDSPLNKWGFYIRGSNYVLFLWGSLERDKKGKGLLEYEVNIEGTNVKDNELLASRSKFTLRYGLQLDIYVWGG